MTGHGLTEEDTRDRDRWRNLVLGEGKPLQSGQTLDDDDDDGIGQCNNRQNVNYININSSRTNRPWGRMSGTVIVVSKQQQAT
jgi:hypothetical protein